MNEWSLQINTFCCHFSGQNGDVRSPKRVFTDYRSVLVERNSFASPVKDRLLAFNNHKGRLPPPLQSAFARYLLGNSAGECSAKLHLHYTQYYLFSNGSICVLMCSPTRQNPGGGGETCAETGINIFFSKVQAGLKNRFNLTIGCAT